MSANLVFTRIGMGGFGPRNDGVRVPDHSLVPTIGKIFAPIVGGSRNRRRFPPRFLLGLLLRRTSASPSRTSGDVGFRAAIRGEADITRRTPIGRDFMSTRPSHLERKFVTLQNNARRFERGSALWRMLVQEAGRLRGWY